MRGGIKLAVLAHEMTHALKLNNDKISVNAIEEYFRNRYNQHQSERGRKRRVNTSTLSEPVQAAADHPKVLEFLRGQTIRSFREVTDRPIPGVERMRLEEQRAVIFDRERQIMDGEAYALQLPTGRYELHELGESIGQRMGQIDINTGKPYAGLVALREVLRRGDANFARVEHEILEGRHDVAIAEVGRIVSEELRRGREKQFKKK